MSAFELLKLTPLPAHLMSELQARYQVHDHGHLSDPSVLGRVAVMIGTGEMIVDAKLLATYPKVQLICVVGESYENIDMDAVKAKNIFVSATPGVADEDVADLALGLVLSVIRKIPQADRFIRNSDWVEGAYSLSRKVTGARMGLLGSHGLMKAIGKRAQGFDMRLAYFDQVEDAVFSKQTGMRYFSDLTEMAKEIDVLVLCAQGKHGCPQVVNAQVIDALGANAYVINVGDAALLDQGALIKAVQQKKLAGAALDVFVGEPKVAPEWRMLQNVVLTPHIGARTEGAQRAMSNLALAHLKAFFEHRDSPSEQPNLLP